VRQRIFCLNSLIFILSLACTAPNANADGNGITRYTYKVVARYDHDVSAYTQGLVYVDGYLLEGTGNYGRSDLRLTLLGASDPVRYVPLENRFFGEGVALVDGTVFQLTWKGGTAIVYDYASFAEIDRYYYSGEGWGLTWNGEYLILSDGSNRLRLLRSDDFSQVDEILVTRDEQPLYLLNELEFINGQIYANVYPSDLIVIIDPASGEVRGEIDLSGLLPDYERTNGTDVLNGIAWDAAGERLLVTGKNWPAIFHIELVRQ
jgi:glutamine cyclotransferase